MLQCMAMAPRTATAPVLLAMAAIVGLMQAARRRMQSGRKSRAMVTLIMVRNGIKASAVMAARQHTNNSTSKLEAKAQLLLWATSLRSIAMLICMSVCQKLLATQQMTLRSTRAQHMPTSTAAMRQAPHS